MSATGNVIRAGYFLIVVTMYVEMLIMYVVQKLTLTGAPHHRQSLSTLDTFLEVYSDHLYKTHRPNLMTVLQITLHKHF